MSADAFDRFCAGATRARAPELVPEIRLLLADDLPTLWQAHEAWTGRLGGPAPYWGIAWPGGQALARYLLDHSGLVKGRTVLDIGSGSGICAIAAARAGAGKVVAADIDPYARLAVAGNARRNGVAVTTQAQDPIGGAGNWDIILAADLWYERFLAQRLTAWLAEAAQSGTAVYLADPGRAHFPRQGLEEISSHRLQPAPGLEPGNTANVRVWRFALQP